MANTGYSGFAVYISLQVNIFSTPVVPSPIQIFLIIHPFFPLQHWGLNCRSHICLLELLVCFSDRVLSFSLGCPQIISLLLLLPKKLGL
jgi:hypothetical protein